jgi:hypothetical protein
VHALHPVLCSLFPELVSGDTGCLRLFTDLPRQFQAFYEVEPRALSQRRIAMKEAGSAEQFRLLQQEIVLAGEAVEKRKRDQQLSGARSFLLLCRMRRDSLFFFLPFRIPPY